MVTAGFSNVTIVWTTDPPTAPISLQLSLLRQGLLDQVLQVDLARQGNYTFLGLHLLCFFFLWVLFRCSDQPVLVLKVALHSGLLSQLVGSCVSQGTMVAQWSMLPFAVFELISIHHSSFPLSNIQPP